MAFTRGNTAIQSALSESGGNGGRASTFASFKSGSSYKVRINSLDDVVGYEAASVFKVFDTTPVEKKSLYHKAAELLYQDAKNAKDESTSEAIRKQAYLVKPKPRYILAAIDLETGEKLYVDLTKNQAKAVIAVVQKKAKKLDSLAFELTKTGESTSTAVSLTQLDPHDEDDCDAKELENFNKSKDVEFTDEDFEALLQYKGEDEQLDDLYQFDRKLADRVAGKPSVNASSTQADKPGPDVDEDDLPF